jgi:hypothetical protein
VRCSPDLPPTTGYARLGPWEARIVLAVILATALLAVALTLSPMASGRAQEQSPGEGDTALYRAEVERIATGEGYYEAARTELTRRGYPTRSVFNWRTPLPMWMIGKLPDDRLAKWLLGIMALGVMVLAFEVLAREQGHGLGRPLACALLLTGPMAPCVLYDEFVAPMSWAAIFIALSICGYGLCRPRIGVGMGLAAVFFRELALPYCLLAAALAAAHRRWKELAAWCAGLAAWGLFFAAHWVHVSRLVTPDAVAHREGWVQFGGLPFVIATAQANLYLLFMPQWVTAVFFVAAMVGLAGWNTSLGERIGLTVCLFVVAFAVVGQEFNQYWGLLIGPLFCFGVVRFPASIRDLGKAANAFGRCRYRNGSA